MKQYIAISAALLLIHSISAYCITETGYSYTNASVQKGQLSGIKVASIYDDGTHTWFGTRTEILRLGASDQKSWNHSIYNVNSIAVDRNGCLWIATPNGVFYFDAEYDDFRQVDSSALTHCTSVGDEIWVYGFSTLNIFDVAGKRHKKTIAFPPGYHLIDVCPLPDGNVILSSRDKGLQRFNTANGVLEDFSKTNVTKCRVVRMFRDKIYACSYGQGVWRYSTSGTCIGKLDGVPSDYTTSIDFYDGKIWVGTDGGGIGIIDLDDGSATRLHNIPDNANSFPSNAIAALYSGSNGDLWASTVRNGVFNIHRKYIFTYPNSHLGTKTGLSEKCVVSFSKDENGMLWIGTDGQGINSFDPSSGEFFHFPATFGLCVPSICQYDADGTLLASIFNNGLYLFYPRTGSFQAFSSEGLADSGTLFDDGSYPILNRVREDRIFIFSPIGYALDLTTGKSTQLKFESGEAVYDQPSIWYCRDYILAGFKGGIYINRYDDYILHSLVQMDKRVAVSAMHCDTREHILWVALDYHRLGYYGIDDRGNIISDFHPINDIQLKNITSLTTDTKGRLWISAQGMLATYERATGNTRLFSVFDGFEWNDIIAACNTEITDSTFFLGGTSGIVSINTRILDETGRTDVPNMFLKNYLISDRQTTFDREGRKRIVAPSKHSNLVLNYGVNGVQFFENPLIKYTISGSTQTILSSSDPSLDLTSLGPGKYTITAECKCHGISSTTPEVITLVIRKPWYASALFIILLACIMVAAIIFYTYRYVKKRLSSQKEVSDRDNEFLRRFCEYVAINIDQELSAEVLTKELGVSRTLLYEKVRNLTGNSVNEYIKHLRIERAQALLRDTDLSINEISYTVGFTYPRYFSSVFKDVTGCTPTEYKRGVNTQQR